MLATRGGAYIGMEIALASATFLINVGTSVMYALVDYNQNVDRVVECKISVLIFCLFCFLSSPFVAHCE